MLQGDLGGVQQGGGLGEAEGGTWRMLRGRFGWGALEGGGQKSAKQGAGALCFLLARGGLQDVEGKPGTAGSCSSPGDGFSSWVALREHKAPAVPKLPQNTWEGINSFSFTPRFGWEINSSRAAVRGGSPVHVPAVLLPRAREELGAHEQPGCKVCFLTGS